MLAALCGAGSAKGPGLGHPAQPGYHCLPHYELWVVRLQPSSTCASSHLSPRHCCPDTPAGLFTSGCSLNKPPAQQEHWHLFFSTHYPQSQEKWLNVTYGRNSLIPAPIWETCSDQNTAVEECPDLGSVQKTAPTNQILLQKGQCSSGPL